MPPVYLSRKISIYFTFLFLNIGLSPNIISYVNFFVIGIIPFILISGNLFIGGILIIIVQLLDCCDGEMARVHGSTLYGQFLDSLGADLFYALVPSSVGIYLYKYQEIENYYYPLLFLIAGVFSSSIIVFCRMLRYKSNNFNYNKSNNLYYKQKNNPTKGIQNNKSIFKELIFSVNKLFRSKIFRNNFFAEPGMCLIFFILGITTSKLYLGFYLIILFIYYFFYATGTVFFSFQKIRSKTLSHERNTNKNL